MIREHSENCPSNEALLSLLSGKTGSGSHIAQHVDFCSQCQSSLDHLSERDYLTEFRDPVQKSRDATGFMEPSADPAYLGMIDDIAIGSKIGAGGMGIVFRGDDLKLGRTVAVKVLKRGSSLESNRRFLRETRAAAKLKHPNLVPVYSAGQAVDGRPYLVMPLVEGTSLKERLDVGLPAPLEAARIARQIATGLEHAHQQDICHRDIKPANILLDSDDHQAKLADFGLVRTVGDDTLTEQDVICGTPEYMSPNSGDETSDSKLDDIYSLGVVLYECLTGTTPFRGQPLDVLQQHRSVDPQPPRHLNRAIPVDLETICLKSLTKEPSQRYASATELADDLSRFLEDRPILARREGIVAKSKRWVRKNSVLASVIGLSFFLLSAGTTTSTFFWLKSERNAKLAHGRLESIEKINQTLQQNQTELSRALRNSPATGIASYSLAGDLPTSVRNSLLTEVATTWRLLFERAKDNQVELREIAAQLVEVTDVAAEMGMFMRVGELTDLSRDIATQLLSFEDATAHDQLLAAQIYEQAALAEKKGNQELALEHLNTARGIAELAAEHSSQNAEHRSQADIQLSNLHRTEVAWLSDKAKAIQELTSIRESLPPLDSLDSKMKEDWAWLNQHQKVLLELAKKSDPATSISLRQQRGQIIDRMLPPKENLDSKYNILTRKKSVNMVMIGIALSRIGRTEEALKQLDLACVEFEGLLVAHPQNAQYRADLFESRIFKANLLWNSGEKEESLVETAAALDFQRLTLQLNPGDPALHSRTANVLELTGKRHRESGHLLLSAEANLEAAVAMHQAVEFSDYSSRERYRNKQAQLFELAIELFEEANKPAKAEHAKALFRKVYPGESGGDLNTL